MRQHSLVGMNAAKPKPVAAAPAAPTTAQETGALEDVVTDEFWQDFSLIAAFSGGRIFPKLEINTPGDALEIEADRMADRVMQNGAGIGLDLTRVSVHGVQRDCSDSDFCTPYPTTAEADSSEWWIRHTYLPLEGIPTFGTEVGRLWESFLDRSPGDSLDPVEFSGDTYLVSGFRGSGDTADDQDAVIDLVGNRLSRAPGGPLPDNTTAMMSLANFLSPSEMNNRPINYSNPFSVAGHIAGGIGSSDAGPDYRKITYGNVTLEKVPVIGNTGYVRVETTLHYEVFDAVDFCPGDCGSPLEQVVTIPMSRLEASGAAYDVPFKVIFTPDSRSKRFWY